MPDDWDQWFDRLTDLQQQSIAYLKQRSRERRRLTWFAIAAIAAVGTVFLPISAVLVGLLTLFASEAIAVFERRHFYINAQRRGCVPRQSDRVGTAREKGFNNDR